MAGRREELSPLPAVPLRPGDRERWRASQAAALRLPGGLFTARALRGSGPGRAAVPWLPGAGLQRRAWPAPPLAP